MAHRTASKPALSLRSLSEICGKDFFSNGRASSQWPVSASFAPRSPSEEGEVVGAVLLATWAGASGASVARRRAGRIVFERSLIDKKGRQTLPCLPSQFTLRLKLEEELQRKLNI